jgi:hypothetical protein
MPATVPSRGTSRSNCATAPSTAYGIRPAAIPASMACHRSQRDAALA